MSETFAPPRTATNGLSGFVTILPSAAISFSRRKPQPRSRISLRERVHGGVRAVHGAERVVDVDVAELGELLREGLVVLLLFRDGSGGSRAGTPGRRADRRRPSSRRRRCSPRGCAPRRRAARRGARRTGSSESFGSGPFFGRPRWLARMTRAPRSSACLMVGSASTMRASSVMTCLPSLLLERDVEVDADEDALVLDRQVLDRRDAGRASSW